MKKFDIIVANPPYSKNLHLKFLDKCVDMANEEVVFVHPSSQYIAGKGENKMYNKIVEKIKPIIRELDFFNGNPIFNIGLFVPCVITHINKKISDKFRLINRIYSQDKMLVKDEVKNLAIWGHREEFINLKRKIREISDNGNLKDLSTVLGFHGDVSDKKVLKNSDSYFAEFSHIRGSVKMEGNTMIGDDFFTFSRRDFNPEHRKPPRYTIWFEFDSREECLNFIEYTKTYFARFCLSIVKNNQNIAQNELKWIPVVDFTRSWSDEELYEHFGITKEEQAFIKEIIPPYYDR